MKRTLLILTTLLISSSLWAQSKILEDLKSKHPEYTTRIDAAYKFLKERNLDFDNNSFGGPGFIGSLNNEVKINAYPYKNGRVIIIIRSNKPESKVIVDIKEVDKKINNTILTEQLSGRVLTDVLNLGNYTFEDPDHCKEGDDIIKIIQEVKLGTESDKLIFSGPMAILVTLDPTERLDLEDMMFKSISKSEFERTLLVKMAYDDFKVRKDFRNRLILYTGAEDLHISDRDLIEMMMNRMLLELEHGQDNRISTESALMLSENLLPDFMEKVYKVHTELKPFYELVKEWHEELAVPSLKEINSDYKYRKNPVIEEMQKDFYVNIVERIVDYMVKYPDRKTFIK